MNVQRIKSHGGSIRIWIVKESSSRLINNRNINNLIKKEKFYSLNKKSTFTKFYDDIKEEKIRLNNFLKSIRNENIYGYGAPAKAVTLINFFELGKDRFNVIIDDSN